MEWESCRYFFYFITNLKQQRLQQQFIPNFHLALRMSAKNAIQNLEDSQLIRIFLDFVQCFHLQYEKIDKQISYKCHEATWILASTKATGYGRTEPEAYKHALRNLLQILIQDPKYTQFFTNMLTSFPHNKLPPPHLSSINSQHLYSNTPTHSNTNCSIFNKQFQSSANPPPQSSHTLPTNTSNKNKSTAVNKPPAYSHHSSTLASNPNNGTYNTQNKQFKTQSQNRQSQPEVDNSQNNSTSNIDYFYQNTPNQYNNLQNNSKISKYQLASQSHQHSLSNNKILTTPISSLNPINPATGTQPHNQQQNYTYKKIKNSTLSSIPSSTNQHPINEEIIANSINSNKKLIGLGFNKNVAYQQGEHQYQHEGNREQSYPNSNSSLQRASHKRISNGNDQQNYDQQLKQAKQKYNKLKEQLTTITDQNTVLKQQIDMIIQKMSNNKKNKDSRPSIDGTIPITTISNKNSNQQNSTIKSACSYINTANNNTRLTILKDLAHTNLNTSNPIHQDINTSIMNEEQSLHQGQNKLTMNILTTSYSKINGQENINPRPSITSHANNTHNNQPFPHQGSTLNQNKDTSKSKVMVPKLKLEILPNYHKKIQKSLNDSLLAVYQQKHGHVRQNSNTNVQSFQGNNEDTTNLKSFINANQNQVKKGM